MRVKEQKVYRCDFCRKYALRSLAKHERHCTGNINRECRMCGRHAGTLQAVVDRANASVQFDGEPRSGVTNIRHWNLDQLYTDLAEEHDKSGGCPMCTLTVIRHSKLGQFPCQMRFNLKEEIARWWADVNEEERMHDERSIIEEGLR